MATTTDYLNQLKKDLTTAKTNLANLGVEVLESDTFTEVSEKMASIQSGADLSEYFTETIDKGVSSSSGGWFKVLKKLPPLSFNGTKCDWMFCYFMGKEIDFSNFDTSNTTSMTGMFYYAGNSNNPLELDLRSLNTSKVTSTESMFSYAQVKSINMENCDLSKVIKVGSMFSNTNSGLLTDLIFGKNFGAGFSTSQNANYAYYKLDLSKLTKLTETSLISVLNGLADIASLGVQTQSCVLGSTNLAKLTSEAGQQALAQAQAYGWTVS